MPDPATDGTYWSLPQKGILQAREELKHQKVNVRFFFYDKHLKDPFQKSSREILDAQFDGLLIAPVTSGYFEDFIERIPKTTPYVFFDSFIPHSRYLTYIGQDSFQSGVLSGRLMHLLVREPAAFAVIKVAPKEYHIEDRAGGFISYCRKCPDHAVTVHELDSNLRRKDRHAFLEKILLEHRDLAGIFVANADTYLVAEFLKEKHPKSRIHLIGYDLIADNTRYLKEGYIDFLISQQPELQGFEGLITLFRHVVLNLPVKRKVLVKLDIVTRENIDYYNS
jgi:LacI family transcriptional regulator